MMDDATMVVDATTALTSTALRDLLKAKELEYNALQEVHTDLWRQRQRAALDREDYVTFLMTEDRMALLLTEMEQLPSQIEHTRLVEAVRAGQAQHDEAVPRIQALAEQFVEGLGHLATAVLRPLEQELEHQIAGLATVRSRTGHAEFDLTSGREEIVRLVSLVFPNDPRARPLVELLLDTPPRVGSAGAALRSSPRLQPFAPGAITRYLTSLSEGSNHASDT